MNMEQQQERFWCWAAVAVSVHNFFNPGGLTQGGIATLVLLKDKRIQVGVDCSQTPDLCNCTAALSDALTISGNLRAGGYLENVHLVFDSLKKWVDANLPVAARIVWASGGAHFIALDGYREFRSGAQIVHVEDPLYGPSFQYYDDLVSDYPPGGHWQDTYLVQQDDGRNMATKEKT